MANPSPGRAGRPGVRRERADRAGRPGVRRERAGRAGRSGVRRERAGRAGRPGVRRERAERAERRGVRRRARRSGGLDPQRRDGSGWRRAPRARSRVRPLGRGTERRDGPLRRGVRRRARRRREGRGRRGGARPRSAAGLRVVVARPARRRPAGRSGRRDGPGDVEAFGARHADLVRAQLALPGTPPAELTLVVDDRHHLLRCLADPAGGRLALAMVLAGSPWVVRLRRHLRQLPDAGFTTGPNLSPGPSSRPRRGPPQAEPRPMDHRPTAGPRRSSTGHLGYRPPTRRPSAPRRPARRGPKRATTPP